MLSRKQLKEYRELRGLSLRDVSNYCDITHMMISMIENGERDLTERCYKEIVKGINGAYAAKKAGTLIKGTKPSKVSMEKTEDVPEQKPEIKKPVRKTTAKKAATKK